MSEWDDMEFRGLDENGCEVFDKPFDPGWEREKPDPPAEVTIEELRNRLYGRTGLILVTNEGWGGTYYGGKLQLALIRLRDDSYRVMVNGNDDTMMNKDVPDRQAAETVIRRIPVPVSRKALKELGFDAY